MAILASKNYTRQQWAIAFDLSVNAMRLSGLAYGVERMLKTDVINDWISGTRILTFSEHKAECERANTVFINASDKVDTFNIHLKANPTLDVAKVIPTFAAQVDIDGDISSCKTLSNNASENISLVTSKDDLKITAAAPLIAFVPKITAPVTHKDIPEGKIYAYILHYHLDDLSYNLQNIHHHTGEAWNLPKKEYDFIIANRLRAAHRFLPRVDSSDASELGPIVNYIEANLSGIAHNTLGEYIDNNLDKIVASRRGWAIG